jgi:hypothetical protein
VKLRELLKKIRLRPLQAVRPVDNVDGMAADMHAAHGGSTSVPFGLEMPPGYVPSQQDDRPRH